jgi:maltooligosyltrehalose trehalohydrolase
MRDIGAVWVDGKRCRFRLWAPQVEGVQLHLVRPEDRVIAMSRAENGYHQATLDTIAPGTRYRYRLRDGREFADPVSTYQPEGVFGPSEVIPQQFPWTDAAWHGVPIETYVIYELHTGTFTRDGTFESVIPHLDALSDLGVTAIELMPVAQFPGNRNWGYDGVYPFAAQNSYGGPIGLKRLVNACHERNLAVILDVVYNHLGPEGNFLPQFGPYFTDRYKTPWGAAINYDDAGSDEVRQYFIENALYWITEFHIDALRLDAVHAILDYSARTFLEELATSVLERGTTLSRRVYTIGESNLNDTRLIRSPELGGYGLDAQWNEDFHHSLHTLLTKENEGYYVDYGDLQHMAQAFSEGFVRPGQYSVYRKRRHGNSSRDVSASKFVVYAQNHDQIGNRMFGERLSHLVSFEHLKLAAATVLLSPCIPLLFMGEEYGETASFRYFVSHSNPELIEAVRQGRKHEFSSFKWQGNPPDPQSEDTFNQSKLHHELKQNGRHRTLLDFHRELLHLRQSKPALRSLNKARMNVSSLENEGVLLLRRWAGSNEVIIVLNFSEGRFRMDGHIPPGKWCRQLDSADKRWMGPGSGLPSNITSESTSNIEMNPTSVLLLERCVED